MKDVLFGHKKTAFRRFFNFINTITRRQNLSLHLIAQLSLLMLLQH